MTKKEYEYELTEDFDKEVEEDDEVEEIKEFDEPLPVIEDEE